MTTGERAQKQPPIPKFEVRMRLFSDKGGHTRMIRQLQQIAWRDVAILENKRDGKRRIQYIRVEHRISIDQKPDDLRTDQRHLATQRILGKTTRIEPLRALHSIHQVPIATIPGTQCAATIPQLRLSILRRDEK
ncbi:hypothetical protein XcuCFBP2542_17715 [Xanthomonas cucurbitae]|uniref:Uncharacterized protein n=1 Tax=Xanthomonas cucurbitae TaxID=56453 RepID=A0A2S7DDL0_9XANT|nr:hypothetical protein XcuCFBP2542_17715 [Xanthomonas cucurbitae]